jgi:5-methylcytosine-specific restriction protein A
MASGVITKEPHEQAHYDSERDSETALYVGVRFDALLHPPREAILGIDQIQAGSLGEFISRVQYAPKSGLAIPPTAAGELEIAWAAFLTGHGHQPIFLADEVTTPSRFFEGATRQISVNIYERSPYARQRCIEHYGYRCAVCDFDFEQVFGELGRAFIHVHHLKPLSEIEAEYQIDPIADLRPICPNCHAMIHRGATTLSIEDLREMIRGHAPLA